VEDEPAAVDAFVVEEKAWFGLVVAAEADELGRSAGAFADAHSFDWRPSWPPPASDPAIEAAARSSSMPSAAAGVAGTDDDEAAERAGSRPRPSPRESVIRPSCEGRSACFDRTGRSIRASG
jgi:hypothetical protein